MVVVSVAGLPHGMHQRSERLILAIEARDEPGETRERAIGLAVGCALLEVDADFLAGGLAALELHIDELGHRAAARNLGEAAVAENGGLERELRRQSGAHLFFRAHLAGLVIDDDIATVEQAIDAVRARRQTKAAIAERDGDLAANFRATRGEVGTPHRVPADEPGRDPQEARPPERARFRKVFERLES